MDETEVVDEHEDTINLVLEAKPLSLYMNLSEVAGMEFDSPSEEKSFNTLSFGRKRLYSSASGTIAENWGSLIEGVGIDVVLGLAAFRVKSRSAEIGSIEDLITEMDIVLKRSFEFEYRYCDTAYSTNLVYNTKNKELIFEREHVVVLLACAHVFRLSIPLLTSFVVDNPKFSADAVLKEYFFHVIKEVEKFIGRPVNIINKLRRFVESRVYGTEYSDTVIWSYLKNVGTCSVEQVQPLLIKLVTDITPKLTMTENVINFYHVVAKKQLQFLFHANIPYNYETVNSSLEPDEASIFDTNVSKFSQNEMYSCLGELGYAELLSRIKRRVGADLKVSSEEVDAYVGKLVPSKEKIFLFFSVYGKLIEDYELLYTLSRKRYTYCMLLLREIFLKFSMPNLAKIIMSEQEETSKIMASKIRLSKKFLTQIKESEGYKTLRNSYFKAIQEKFDNGNTIFTVLEGVVRVPRYSILQDYDGVAEPVEIDEEALASELINLVKLVL